MRTKEEILEESYKPVLGIEYRFIVEALLDIRDLLKEIKDKKDDSHSHK